MIKNGVSLESVFSVLGLYTDKVSQLENVESPDEMLKNVNNTLDEISKVKDNDTLKENKE
jgi:hypothetical protein